MSFAGFVLGHATSQMLSLRSPKCLDVIYGRLQTPPDEEPWFSPTRRLDICPGLDSSEDEHSDTEVGHIRHTQKNSPWLRTSSASHLPRSETCTCAALHKMASSDFSHLNLSTLIICGVNILCSNGKATSGRITLARADFFFVVFF